MRNWINCSRAVFLPLVVLAICGSVQVAKSQFPGPAQRERNRAMDEHDRTINRMVNDAKRVNERRKSLFPEINEDFQRIQIIHNEMVRMLRAEKGLDYDRLAELSDDMKKRGSRLRSNLALPEPEKNATPQSTHPKTVDDSHMKEDIGDLHDLVVHFVANPIFKNLGVVDSKVIEGASENLNEIIGMSDEIKKEAKLLGKKK